MSEIAARARVRRWRPPNRRRILHAIYLAVILAWAARGGLLIAEGQDALFQLAMVPLWVFVYWAHLRLSRLPTDPHPIEWAAAGAYILLVAYLWLVGI